MDNKDLANLIFPDAKDISYYEEKYPRRNLPEGALVTRVAPSPTGNVHIGTIYQALINKTLARQSSGVFMARIEDTDQKREIEGGIEQIVKSLKLFNVVPDEGMTSEEDEVGAYGPYKQSLRKDIYQSYAKYLIAQGKAYPCFCSPEELEDIRKRQEASNIRPGYYGIWAKYRNLPIEEAAKKIEAGEDYIVRFKSPGREDRKIQCKDVIKGKVTFPENDLDIPIIKSDGLPTYHFAHAVDDHLMGTNLVMRGDEWLSSLPLHVQLFSELGFETPRYAHTATLLKNDNGNKRKISKRKDLEASVSYYLEEGIPSDSVKEYLMNIANSNFENWRRENPDKPLEEFVLQLDKMGVSGALFDIVKLLDVSKNVLSKYSAQRIYDESLEWAKVYDSELQEMLEQDKEYALKVFGIERGNIKPRKDIAKWSDIKNSIVYMFDDKFEANNDEYEFQKIADKEEIQTILKEYLEKHYNPSDDKQVWFDKMKDLAEDLGYAREVKEYKANPDSFKGHVGDISTVLRVALTKRANTPDLYEIMQIIGLDRMKARYAKFTNC